MSKIRIILDIIIGIVIGILFLYCFYLYKKAENLTSYKSLYEVENKQNKIYRDKDSTWRNKSQDVIVSKSQLDQVKELQNLHKEFDGVKKSLSNLENYTKLSEVTTINKTIYIIDSSFIYSDKYDTIKGIIKNGKVNLTDIHRDSLIIVQYWDRAWFLGKKKYYTDIKSTNPNTKIDYQKNIKTERKKGLFHL